ncbi:SIR2 family protein [Chryseobacterium cucumeris]|uniref:SIR2 family protein n=2 Tax=Chryseobacterium cucumeris TaxID=1813611 RepID=A0ABX9X4G4_9FLAO|nr:SIR2 family protein [Chryseobacterium cucumeris]
MSPEIKQFIEDYAEELVSGNAAYFIGAGISINSQLPNWPNLIKPFAKKIGINKLDGKDLPEIAQYIINEEKSNRGPFIDAISRKLRKNYSPNAYHEAIVKTNLKTIWTTNYDNLIEKAFSNTTVDVKFTDEAISRDVPDNQIEIIKMHGCIHNSDRSDIIITQSDYEDFFLNKPAITQRLRLDLLQKSFLFIGYGYGDSNIKNIITEARRLGGNNTRQHYLITKDKINDRDFDLWCENLRRYGIRVIKINDYADLLLILEKLSLRSRGKSIFITGSHDTKNNKDVKLLSKKLAIKKGIILNDGQSSGLMRIASNTFMQTLIENKKDVNKRLKFFPNPYAANSKFANDASLLPVLKQWRIPLLKSTHIMIAFDGGMGTKAEIEVALDWGCTIIPFFKDKKRDTWQLLDNTLLKERVSKYNSNYITKVKKNKINHIDVLKLIRKIIK